MTKSVVTVQDAKTLLSRQRKAEMANTRRASFRLGAETEQKLNELARIAGNSRTEVVRSLISNRHAELHPVKEPKKSVETDPAQMILDEILSNEIRVDR